MESNTICNISVSVGELYDKYSILKIKLNKIKDEEKQKYIVKEIRLLQNEIDKLSFFDDELMNKLTAVNSILWDVEDEIRIKERLHEFDDRFISLARSVYVTNDQRFEIKNEVNQKYNAQLFEVKSYEKYINTNYGE